MQLKIMIQFIKHIISQPGIEIEIEMQYKGGKIYNFCKDNKFKFEYDYYGTHAFFSGVNSKDEKCWLILIALEGEKIIDRDNGFNDSVQLSEIQICNGNDEPESLETLTQAILRYNDNKFRITSSLQLNSDFGPLEIEKGEKFTVFSKTTKEEIDELKQMKEKKERLKREADYLEQSVNLLKECVSKLKEDEEAMESSENDKKRRKK